MLAAARQLESASGKVVDAPAGCLLWDVLPPDSKATTGPQATVLEFPSWVNVAVLENELCELKAWLHSEVGQAWWQSEVGQNSLSMTADSQTQIRRGPSDKASSKTRGVGTAKDVIVDGCVSDLACWQSSALKQHNRQEIAKREHTANDVLADAYVSGMAHLDSSMLWKKATREAFTANDVFVDADVTHLPPDDKLDYMSDWQTEFEQICCRCVVSECERAQNIFTPAPAPPLIVSYSLADAIVSHGLEDTAGPIDITIDRRSGAPLGFDVSCEDLLVVDIDGGLIGKWNDDNPGQVVHRYDRIIGVNGITDDVEAIIEEFMKPRVLHISLRRRDKAPDPLPDVNSISLDDYFVQADEKRKMVKALLLSARMA